MSYILNSGAGGSGGGGVESLAGNTGGALTGALSLVTANSTVTVAGSGTTLTQDFGINNLVLGSSLPALTTGNGNVGLGDGVFAALTSGRYSVAIGLNALNSFTTGDLKVAIGWEAMSSATTGGSSSVAIGSNAMRNVTTGGTQSVAVGNSTMGNVTSGGSQSVAVGNGAMGIVSTNASRTVAVGFQALQNVTGDSCVGIGYGALQSSTSGTHKTAIGDSALFGATTGAIRSVSIGGRAMEYADGTDCVAIGFRALASASGSSGSNTGNNCIAIGKDALDSVTSGSDNVSIGKDSGNAYTTESNNITIGSNVTGTVADSGVIRLGLNGTQTSCYVAGIDGVNVGDVAKVITMASDQLGTATITAGSGITVTPTANTITIAASGGGGGITTINGDVGSVTGDPITLTGGVSGAIFTGSGSTLTQSFDFLALPATTATDGQITIDGSPFLHAFGTNNTFLGHNVGNFTSTTSLSIGIGTNALESTTTGANKIAIGWKALQSATSGGSNSIAIGEGSMDGVTTGSANNIGIGVNTLGNSGFTGSYCIAIGSPALNNSTSGDHKIAIGRSALQGSTSGGVDSIAIGWRALEGTAGTAKNNSVAIGTSAAINTTGGNLVAIGYEALGGISGGKSQSVAVGYQALTSVVGTYNIGVGYQAGFSASGTDSNNIFLNNAGTAGDNNTLRIGAATGTGTQQLNKAFIHGIRGITTGVADAINVLVDSAGQLGTVSSSIRYKENVEDMGDVSSGLKDLRPVTFDYKDKPSHKKQVGLIAEEVEKVMPNLVVYNQDGEVETVKYHELPTLLLNELQKALKRIEALEEKLGE